MLSGKQLSSHLRIALRHKILVHKAATLARVPWDMLLTNFVSRTADPVNTCLRVVAINVWVDVLLRREVACLLKMAGQLQSVKLLRPTTSKNDLSVD